MIIPKEIKIGAHVVEVVVTEWASDRMGAAHIVPNKIYINTTNCKSQQEATLFHEIIETINNMCDLELNHTQIAVLEHTLHQVLADNELCFKKRGE